MGDAARTLSVDHAAYLALEAASPERHEWYDGAIYAMAGGTIVHGELSTAVLVELSGLARACGCRVTNSDVRVRVLATGLATYPDAAVGCGERETDPADRNALANPAVLVEVLSDGTEAYDRGEKFAHYRQIPSLRDFVLVSQHEPRIEVYSREGDHWVLRVAEAGQHAPLTALTGALSVDRVYDGVTLEPRPVRATL